MEDFQSLSEGEIHDVLIRRLPRTEGPLDLYHYSDHLLSRIGLIQLQQREPSDSLRLILRPDSDELWFLLEGQCEFTWVDLREESPTHQVIQQAQAAEPTMVLAPFGVAFGAISASGCRLLRVAQFSESEGEQPKTFSWPPL